jgi:hypothetical protein
MDQVLWKLPAAKALVTSPAVQMVRWAQARFPALYPGGVVDTSPLMRPPRIPPPRVPSPAATAGKPPLPGAAGSVVPRAAAPAS